MTKHDDTSILVTGSTGTVGSEVVKQLASPSSVHGVIKAAVHSRDKADKFKSYNSVEIVDIDYNRSETIADALENVDKLFWLTPLAPNMTEISSNLVKEAKKNDVRYIVKLSVMGADAEPGTTIGRVHRQEEKIIEESGIPYTFLRCTAFMQNFVNFFGPTIKTQNAFYIPAGDGKVSFVDVRDIAVVATEILTKSNAKKSQQYENKAYAITGEEALSYSQAAEILSNEIGKKISYIDIPEEDARKAMKEAGIDGWHVDALMELYRIIRADHASQTTATVEEIIGRKPLSLAQFAKDYVEFFR
ncbi:MAG: NAD(P)-dependent oxidoreductase [Candidatus Nitrosopolaris wilkensis]|nr:MAG: NAD(P)-dependent oxidoreductase [Candidatus Nitrosopolaris wilkensis]